MFLSSCQVKKDEQWRRAMEYVSCVSELNYMSQIVIMLYEDPTKDPYSEERFHIELHFSPGVNCCVQKNLPPGPGFRPHSRNESAGSKNCVSKYFFFVPVVCLSNHVSQKLIKMIAFQKILQNKKKVFYFVYSIIFSNTFRYLDTFNI